MNTKNKCSYCNKEITGFVNKSRINKVHLCNNCYYIEMFLIAMSKNIQESEREYGR